MPMKFSGHETFACRYVWSPKALQAIQSDPRVFADEDEAIVELGVGKNMVRSIRFWVEASGMAKPAQQGLEPTKLGLLIFGAKGWDPFIEDIQTLWLIHWNLTTQIEHPLFAWSFCSIGGTSPSLPNPRFSKPSPRKPTACPRDYRP
jgi:hypothetical protein